MINSTTEFYVTDQPNKESKVIRLLSGVAPVRNIGRNIATSSRLFDFLKDCEQLAYRNYRNSKFTVKGDHMLVTFINSILIPINLNKDRYAMHVEDAALQVARTLGFATQISDGQLFNKGYFYGDSEVIYGLTEDADTKSPWYDLRPIKVVMHPRSDITFTLLDGTPNTNEQGLSVIQINLVELMLMYRGFRRWQLHQFPETPAGATEFIGSWVLPSMMQSHNSVSILNRIKLSLLGLPFSAQLKRTYFNLPKNDYLENKYREYVLKSIQDNNYPWNDLLQLVSVAPGVTLLEYGRSPDVVKTRYGKAITLLATMSYVNYLLLASSVENKSSTEAQDLALTIRRYSAEKWFGYSKLAHVVNKYLNDNIISLM